MSWVNRSRGLKIFGNQSGSMALEEKGRPESQYDVYLEERKLLVEAEREGARTFDKAILTLAAGALALSMTFLEKVVPIAQATTLWSLASSWAAFGLSIFLILFSFLTSQWACIRQRAILDKEWLPGPDERSSERNNWTTATTILNVGSIFSFAVGVIFLCYFSFANLPKEVTMSKKQKDYGYVPPKAPAKTVEKGFTPPKSPTKPPIEEGYTPPKTPVAPPAPVPAPEKK